MVKFFHAHQAAVSPEIGHHAGQSAHVIDNLLSGNEKNL